MKRYIKKSESYIKKSESYIFVILLSIIQTNIFYNIKYKIIKK